MLNNCVNTIERVMGISTIRPDESGLVLKVLLKAKRFDQARIIVALWDKLGLGDRPAALRARMQVEAGSGSHTLALEAGGSAAEEGAEGRRGPAHSRLVTEEIRKTLRSAGE